MKEENGVMPKYREVDPLKAMGDKCHLLIAGLGLVVFSSFLLLSTM